MTAAPGDCIHARLRGVTIENRDAFDICPTHDAQDTLFYFDPPYLRATLGGAPEGGNAYYRRNYNCDLTEVSHAELVTFLRTLQGMVVLSGYAHPLYDNALPDWQRITRKAFADGAREREEVLWISPRTWERLGADRRRALTLRQAEFAMDGDAA